MCLLRFITKGLMACLILMLFFTIAPIRFPEISGEVLP